MNANSTVDSLWYTKEEKRSDDDSKRLQIKVNRYGMSIFFVASGGNHNDADVRSFCTKYYSKSSKRVGQARIKSHRMFVYV